MTLKEAGKLFLERLEEEGGHLSGCGVYFYTVPLCTCGVEEFKLALEGPDIEKALEESCSSEYWIRAPLKAKDLEEMGLINKHPNLYEWLLRKNK